MLHVRAAFDKLRFSETAMHKNTCKLVVTHTRSAL